jgi:hypothetical protein
MGRHKIKPLSYGEITTQAEKTITMLMRPAKIKSNCEQTKEQSVSRALGAFVLWEDLTENFQVASDDKDRLFKLLDCGGEG